MPWVARHAYDQVRQVRVRLGRVRFRARVRVALTLTYPLTKLGKFTTMRPRQRHDASAWSPPISTATPPRAACQPVRGSGRTRSSTHLPSRAPQVLAVRCVGLAMSRHPAAAGKVLARAATRTVINRTVTPRKAVSKSRPPEQGTRTWVHEEG